MNPTRHAAAIFGAAGLCLALSLAGCGDGGKSAMVSAVGSYGDVALVVSDPRLDPLLERARGLLSPVETFVLKTEPTYRFRTFTGKNWQDARNYRNVILAVRWGDGGPVQGAVKRLLPKDALKRALAGRGEVFTVRDPWLHSQLAFVAVARDADALVTLLNRQAPSLSATLTTDINRRIVADHRQQGLLADPAARQWRRFGFSVELPAAYRENQSEPGGFPGVEWLRTDGSTRGLTVSWEPASAPESRLLDQQFLVAMRERLGKALHQETIEPAILRVVAGDGGRPARRQAGRQLGRRRNPGRRPVPLLLPGRSRGRARLLLRPARLRAAEREDGRLPPPAGRAGDRLVPRTRLKQPEPGGRRCSS